jgi:HD-GYP domain-containing protein (c-di-GMP phosphodiesterase class II)
MIRSRRFTDKRAGLGEIKSLMEDLEITACLPAYYRTELLGIILLGKKVRGGRFNKAEISFFEALANDVAMAILNAQLFEEKERESERRYKLFTGSILALAKEIDAKDHYTAGHTERVIDYSLAIANKLKEKGMFNITDEFIEDLKTASLLHDVGKIGIPENILNKQGKLDDNEFEIIKKHTTIGVSILEPIKDFLREALLGIKYHHERFDGTGYPDGLKNTEIPLIASIVCVADSYDAMITDRPYRKALTKEDAIFEVKRCAGMQFHPEIAEIMLELYGEGKV